MKTLDRYMLAQLLGPLGFFTLVFVGIIWLTQSLKLLDYVVGNSSAAMLFLEFSSLILPRVILQVLPVSAFAAALYTINKLYGESELVVMLGSGLSPWALLRPMLIFGAGVMALLLLLSLYLVPRSTTLLAERRLAVGNELVSSILTPGAFMHPERGVTVFVDDASTSGELRGIFLHDQRDLRNVTTYTADKALLLSDDAFLRIVMFDGLAQIYGAPRDTLSAVQFEQFSYDFEMDTASADDRKKSAVEYPLRDLFSPTQEMLDIPKRDEALYVAAGVEKLMTPSIALFLPALALATILFGGYQRRGFSRRIIFAVIAGIAVQVLAIAALSAIRTNAALAPLGLLPAGTAAGLTFFLLWRLSGRRAAGAEVVA
ncbi:LptF/LptG family permease [Oceanomicrobium pacificus]|uniref:LptF/LptG family permease n=1 Tax=Oceanomicrobium pacificus TaxID=2692916 RepID=A0A6B0TXF9_9RHOB|nr:LptF/LptG family permease [Oceanomicrobium pacificus]MXU65713.1 LptF/LptG family permease [Oceanomicrobium pacificus]